MKYFLQAIMIFVFMSVALNCKSLKTATNYNNTFNGKIIFKVSTTITNEIKFEKELNAHIKKQDSLYQLKNPNEAAEWGSIAPTLRLSLDPREDPGRSNPYFKSLEFDYEYLDTLITYTYSKGRSKYKVEINTVTNDYKKFNVKTGSLINSKRYEFFINNSPYKEIIYRDSLKNINGFDCYKVVIIDKNSEGFGTYKEMYVTDKIKSLYHPLQIRKELIEKYYPLEAKLYSEFLSHKVTRYRVNLIEDYNK